MKKIEIESSIAILTKQTVSQKLSWESTSRMAMFGTFWEDYFVVVDQRTFTEESYEITFLNQMGELEDRKKYTTEDSGFDSIKQLYLKIIDGNPQLQSKYNEAKRIYLEEEERKEKLTITMSKLRKRLLCDEDTERLPVKSNNFFGYVDDRDPKFEMPPLVQIPTTEDYVPLQEAEVLMIAAPGATGKTVLSKHLCRSFDFLRLDLGLFRPVGANSLLGVFVDNFADMRDMLNMTVNLQQGKTTMVIDGLDEASIKTTEEAFEGFLDDIVKLAKGGKGLSFILLGRTKVVEDTCIYLEDAGVKVILTQIEPFTIQKARNFIDKQQESDGYLKQRQQYEQVRNYIIDSIQGFFRNESDIKLQLYERFIGYAPVLLAISRLINENGNYYELYTSLQTSKVRNVELVVNIVERIMERERVKIQELVKNELMHNRPEEFQQEHLPKMYTIQEQCVRLLAFVQRTASLYNISDDDVFNSQYNEKVNEWMKDHPLLDKAKKDFQNTVFESYVIAYLMDWAGKENDVLPYMKRSRGASYMLFDIFRQINKSNIIDYRFVSYLYSSFIALDRANSIGGNQRTGEIQITQKDNTIGQDSVMCFVNFCYGDGDDIVYETEIPQNRRFVLPSYICNILIDAPIKVEIVGEKAEMGGTIQINCLEMAVHARELIIANSKKESSFYSDIFCQSFDGTLEDGNVPKLINRSVNKHQLIIFSEDKLSFPFADYQEEYFEPFRKDPSLMDKYQKLRRLLLLFRANGRGGLARVKSKIENRISNVEIGQKVLEALLAAGVIYEQNSFYFINTNMMDEVLETSYADIQKCRLSDRTSCFLSKIK